MTPELALARRLRQEALDRQYDGPVPPHLKEGPPSQQWIDQAKLELEADATKNLA